jgi:hypothetical protein
VGRIYWAFAIMVLLLVSPAFGQYVAVIQACSRDVLEFCAPDRPEGSRLTECTKAHFQDFSEPCKAALVRTAVVREACGADIHEHCPAVKPGAGRILLCVKQHFAAMSEPCKEAISRAAERKVGSHQSPQSVSKTKWVFGLESFLREHYTSSREGLAHLK